MMLRDNLSKYSSVLPFKTMQSTNRIQIFILDDIWTDEKCFNGQQQRGQLLSLPPELNIQHNIVICEQTYLDVSVRRGHILDKNSFVSACRGDWSCWRHAITCLSKSTWTQDLIQHQSPSAVHYCIIPNFIELWFPQLQTASWPISLLRATVSRLRSHSHNSHMYASISGPKDKLYAHHVGQASWAGTRIIQEQWTPKRQGYTISSYSVLAPMGS